MLIGGGPTGAPDHGRSGVSGTSTTHTRHGDHSMAPLKKACPSHQVLGGRGMLYSTMGARSISKERSGGPNVASIAHGQKTCHGLVIWPTHAMASFFDCEGSPDAHDVMIN